MTVIGINVTAVMMLLRVYAMYEKKKIIVAFVAVIFAAEFSTYAWLLTHGIGRPPHIRLPYLVACSSDTPVSPSQATSPGQTSGPAASPQSASTPSDDGALPPQVEDQMEDVHP